MELCGNLLTPDGFRYGRLRERGGTIEGVSLDDEPCRPSKSTFLLPGFVEVHAAGLGQYISARSSAEVPIESALLAHDASLATAGITTAFTALVLDRIPHRRSGASFARDFIRTLKRAREANVLRVRHLVHLRCELADDGVLADAEALISEMSQDIALVSAMEHVPGRRQFKNSHRWDENYRQMLSGDERAFIELKSMRGGLSDEEFRSRRRSLAKIAGMHCIKFGTHDDETQVDACDAAEIGACLSEFPVAAEVATTLKRRGIPVVVGAPNALRGGSHVGNVSARQLIDLGAASILSSDYAPATVLPAIAALSKKGTLRSDLIEMATSAPAGAVDLKRIGKLEEGSSADILIVKISDGFASISQTWREGNRVS